MKRSALFLLTGLALLSGFGDAARRSGGGFGGSRSSGGSYRAPSSPSYRTPSYRTPSTPSYRTPTPNNSAGSSYTRPRTGGSAAPSSAPKVNLPSTASVRTNPLNTAAAARVTPTQMSNWNKVNLPSGVPRSALTYSAAPSSQYRYQLQPGRYYLYPQSYYRQNNIGYDILKYALIFTAVTSIADAMTPDVVVPPAPAPAPVGGNAPVVAQQSGPNLWTYAGVGFLAAAAGWFMLGRRR